MTPTPKEKAIELVEKFANLSDDDFKIMMTQHAKQCALIAVDEIIDAIKVFYTGAEWQLNETMGWKFWQQTKEEINNL